MSYYAIHCLQALLNNSAIKYYHLIHGFNDHVYSETVLEIVILKCTQLSHHLPFEFCFIFSQHWQITF